MPDQKYLLVIGGPTASGKTSWAIQLAQHFKTEILSCDSRQFYKELSIGTAKPNQEELAQAPHHFINSLSIFDAYSVGDFERDALQLLDQLFLKHQIVILVGGSGLYIKAVCEGLDNFPEIPLAIQEKVNHDYSTYGLSFLQNKLKDLDPVYYKEVDLQNPHRLIRAIAVCEASGLPFSSFRKKNSTPRNFTPIYLQLTWQREVLYERINKRVFLMMEAGLEEEARQFLPQRQLQALQSVGYQELFPYFDNQIPLEKAIEQIQQNSRRYAKRQLTWFRRDAFWKHFAYKELAKAVSYIIWVIKNGLSFKVVEQETNSQQIQFLQKEQVIGSLDIRLHKTTALLENLQQNTNLFNQILPEMLVQEGILLGEGRLIFACIKQGQETLFANNGFTETINEKIPPKYLNTCHVDAKIWSH